jgi:hypothetical protein
MADELETNDFNMDAAVEEIGSGLGLGGETVEDAPEVPETPGTPEVAAPETPEAPVVRAAPKSWAKETHEIWATLPPAAQEQIEKREKQILDGLGQYKGDADFGRSLRDVVTPFQPMLDAHKIDVPKAVSYLLGAHQRLTYGSPESRLAAYQELGRNLGLTAPDPNAPAPDPRYQALEQKVTSLESTLTEKQQREHAAMRNQVVAEVEAFAADKENHPYFDELEGDIIAMLNAGFELKDAYDKAVWANPTTRAKEIARVQTEHEKKVRENLRLDGLKGRKAASPNVRGRDTSRAPTDPLGTMEDTMLETLREIKSRVH